MKNAPNLGKDSIDHRFERGGLVEFQHLTGFDRLIKGLPYP
jgi:hypothetical protein